MAIFGFALGALLFLCGLGSLLVAVNLVPTDMGMLYAVCGVILVGCGASVLAIAALIARVSRLPPRPASAEWPAPSPAYEEPEPQAPPPETASFEEPPAPAPPRDPSQPHVVGRYSSVSGNYMVFSDGAVEAETPEGAYRFASLNDFKAYVASRGG